MAAALLPALAAASAYPAADAALPPAPLMPRNFSSKRRVTKSLLRSTELGLLNGILSSTTKSDLLLLKGDDVDEAK